jgi:hypothetical protein
MQTLSAENLFARSWDLLSRNWAIVIPGIVVAIVSGILTSLLLPNIVMVDDTGVTVMRWFGGLRALLATIIVAGAQIVAISYTTGMAGAAWQRGTATFADGATAFQRDAGKVLTAMLALFVVNIVAAILALPTIFLSLLAVYFLFLYTMPAAVIGEHGGFGALAESYRIATRHIATTAIIAVVGVAIGIVSGIVGVMLHVAPIIGPLLSDVVRYVVLAYLTLAIVGAYLAYRDVGEPVAAPMPPPPPYEPPPPPPATT